MSSILSYIPEQKRTEERWTPSDEDESEAEEEPFEDLEDEHQQSLSPSPFEQSNNYTYDKSRVGLYRRALLTCLGLDHRGNWNEGQI